MPTPDRPKLSDQEKTHLKFAGLHNAFLRQNDILQKFRTTGLAEVVKLSAGRDIPPILFFSEKYGWHLDNMRHIDMARALPEGINPQLEGLSLHELRAFDWSTLVRPDPSILPWDVEVFNPDMDDYGDWNDSLRIRALKTMAVKRPNTYAHQTVFITLTADDNLTVQGARETFSGSIVDPKNIVLEQAKKSIAEAFRKPTVERGRLIMRYASL
jgi:hypothetical protein